MIPSRTGLPLRGCLVLLGGLVPFLAVSCSDDDDDPVVASFVHADVVLRDHLGQPIQQGSNEPYSPRETCGQCHWVDHIANGYHFQQGRTNAAGFIVTEDDYFADGRGYIRSAGMYGKW